MLINQFFFFFCIAQHEPARGVLQARHDMWGRHWYLPDAPGMFLAQCHDLCFLLHEHIKARNVSLFEVLSSEIDVYGS
jgi:hypothetical protein